MTINYFEMEIRKFLEQFVPNFIPKKVKSFKKNIVVGVKKMVDFARMRIYFKKKTIFYWNFQFRSNKDSFFEI